MRALSGRLGGVALLAAAAGAGCGAEVHALPDGGPRPDAREAPDPADAGPPGADAAPGVDAAPPLVDEDGDGLDDALEARLAADYLPYLSLHPSDGCPLGGIVYRLRPHPGDAAKIHVIYVHLFERDCGLNGHVGDDEVFAMTIDPAAPPPAGIVAIKAISHQGTLCERTSQCGACPGLSACDTALVEGVAWPVVYTSKDKHATYARKSSCGFGTCFDTCELNPTRAVPPLVNAGEPDAPLVNDLTTQGFITAANGWTEPSLMNFDPWDPTKDFGSAGNVRGDLTDPEFDTPACH